MSKHENNHFIENFEPLLSGIELLKKVKPYLNGVTFNSRAFQEILKELQEKHPHEGYSFKKYKFSEALAIIKRKHGIEPTPERFANLKKEIKEFVEKVKKLNINSSTLILDDDELSLIKRYKKEFSHFKNGIKTYNKFSKISLIDGILIFEK